MSVSWLDAARRTEDVAGWVAANPDHRGLVVVGFAESGGLDMEVFGEATIADVVLAGALITKRAVEALDGDE